MKVSGPLVFNSWEALVFWGVFIWAFFPEIRLLARSVRAPREAQDAGTARLIFVVNSVTMLAAFAASFLPWFRLPHPSIAFYVGLVLRVRVEEKALLATLGEPYRAYMARTKRFIPFVT